MHMNLQKFRFDRAFMSACLVVAIPMMLQQMVAASVNLVDNLMVGSLGDAALASVAAVNKYYLIALYGINGLTAAGSVFIAQFYGANKEESMKQSFRAILVLTIGIAILFTALGVFAPNLIMQFFTKDPAVIASGAAYVSIVALSFLPNGITTCFYNSIRAVGETKVPLRCGVVAVLVNCALNYCLIFGNFGFPCLGVRGAAIATLISRLVELALVEIAVHQRPFGFKTHIRDLFHISRTLFEHIVSKATPLMTNEVLWTLGMAMLFKFYGTRGSDVMSAYAVSTTIGDIFFTLFAGMAAASTVMISQPLGANHIEEAKKHAYQLVGFSFVLALVFAVFMFLATFLVPYLYSELAMETKEMAQLLLRIQCLMFWIYTITTQFYFILRAGGDMKHTLIMDSGFMWLINIPVVAAVTYFTDLPYVWIYIVGQATDIVKLCFSYHLVSKEAWAVNLTVPQEDL